jgi:hypothetical protein
VENIRTTGEEVTANKKEALTAIGMQWVYRIIMKI